MVVDQLLSKYSQLNPKSFQTKECIELAKQTLQSIEFEKAVDSYLLSDEKPKETRPFPEFFSILFEWYKTKIPELQQVLLRHVPTLIEIFFTKQTRGTSIIF